MVAILVLYPGPLPSTEVGRLALSKWAEMRSVRLSFLWGSKTPGLVLETVAKRLWKYPLEVEVALTKRPSLEILGLHRTRT